MNYKNILKKGRPYIVIIVCIITIYLLFNLDMIRESFTYDITDEDRHVPHYIERQNKNAPKEINGVPLVIYRSWVTNNVPPLMKKNIYKSISITPEFDNYLYSDEDCYKFIEDNFEENVLNAYKSLKPGAYQCDLWRYCILYKKGGIYSDIKMDLQIPLIDILKEHPNIFIWDNPDDPNTFKNQIWNGFMSSPPGNPIFKGCIDEIVLNCKNKDYKDNLLDITGPCLLWRINKKLESTDLSKVSPFTFVIGKYEILYKDKMFISKYKDYDNDQRATQKTEHYSVLYNKKDVFDDSVIFK
jgi:mannosyltransferase OCH1-like enzyme